MKKLISAVVFVALLSPVVAQAAEGMERSKVEKREPKKFARVDLDGNGTLDMSEVEAMFQKRADKKGEELNPKKAKRFMKRTDTDSDGLLSLAEMTTLSLARFDKKDANGDGVLEASER